jgi:hypothetical protein
MSLFEFRIVTHLSIGIIKSDIFANKSHIQRLIEALSGVALGVNDCK